MSDESEKSEWLVEEEQTLLETRVANITSANVRNGRTGKEAEFYRLEFVDWVNVIAITTDQKLVMIRQFRFGSRQVETEIPGGAIEKNEDPVSAGLRELLEETGFTGNSGRIIGEVCPNPAIQNNRCYTIFVENAEKVAEQNMDEMEDIEVITMPLDKVDRGIASGEISHGLVLNGLMFYSRM